MRNEIPPLYYAIIMHFEGGAEDDARGVVKALSKDYASYKLLNVKDVSEALATAKENGILEEAGYGVDAEGELVISYRMSDFGKEMVGKYLH